MSRSSPPRHPPSAAPLAASCLALLCLLPSPAPAAHFEPVRGHGGAVSAEAEEATAAGLAALAAGGNAVDAAVAAALVLAVVHPEAGNLGGGGFAVMKVGDELASLDFRETAPAAASREMYVDSEGDPIPEASLVGPLAAGVPGTPAGLWELHRRFGLLTWARLVAPAAEIAANGFPVSTRLHRTLASERDLLAHFPETARVWLPGGEVPAIGSEIRLPELAATLRAYGERGPEAITTGAVADAVEAASRRHGGILTARDLAAYEPAWREPVTFAAFGWQVFSMDLPSSGGILLGQTLGMLERLGWSAEPRFGADRAHLLAEAWRRAYADRFRLGDPATTRATAAELLDPDWLAARVASIDRSRASPSGEVHPIPVEEPAEAAATTHLSTADAAGNLVALTTTLNGAFGCGLLVPEAGFLLNNEMDDFAAAPGEPNLYGLVQGEANAVAPGKRMLSSISPTLAWRDGDAIALGGRGGARIPSAVAQVLLNLLVDGDDLQAAVARPRLHHQWLPDQLLAEPAALSPETRAELERRGHEVVTCGQGVEGCARDAKVQAVRLRPDGVLEAAADPRVRAVAGVVEELP